LSLRGCVDEQSQDGCGQLEQVYRSSTHNAKSFSKFEQSRFALEKSRRVAWRCWPCTTLEIAVFFESEGSLYRDASYLQRGSARGDTFPTCQSVQARSAARQRARYTCVRSSREIGVRS